MKITYLSISSVPSTAANSIHAVKMCNALANNGHDVTLVAPKADASDANVYDFYGVSNKFRIKRFSLPGTRLGLYGYAFNSALFSLLQKADLTYCMSLPPAFFALVMGRKVIYEAHSPENFSKLHGWLFRFVRNDRKTKRVALISAHLVKLVSEIHGESEKYYVLPDAADKPDFLPKIDFKFNRDRLNIGYLGHLYQGRGINLILELSKRCLFADFQIIGGTEEDIDYWRRFSKDLPNVILHGFVPPALTASYRNECDILLAPYQHKVSISGSERDTSGYMSPMKLFEYMSGRKAIICSDLPVLREVLTHNHTALLCAPDEADEWEKAISSLHANPLLRKRLGDEAYALFLENYTWEKRAENVLHFGEKVAFLVYSLTGGGTERIVST
ncbi:MAG: glycosyltransferase, partial [Bacteroidia bacterium]|nr:glycosyltransferase [Bacteroidia bacterium]